MSRAVAIDYNLGDMAVMGPAAKSGLLIPAVNFHGSDLETAQSSTTADTLDEERVAAPKDFDVPLVSFHLDRTRKDVGLIKPKVLRHTDPDMPPSPTINITTRNTVIQRGFGRFALGYDPVAYDEKSPRYPPPPNAAYVNRIDQVDWSKKIIAEPMLDGAAFAKDNILARQVQDKKLEAERLEKAATRTVGERAAEKIDWNRRLYNGGDVIGSGSPASASSWRRDFVKNIDRAIAAGKEPFSMCNKCEKRHIPWGPPIVIPDWFPVKDLNNPWNSFIGLVNEIVRCAEVEQGLAGNASGPLWDMKYHETSDEWEAVGRHGGWWKCRSGNEEEEEQVPLVERECSFCHRARTAEELAVEAVVKTSTRRRQMIDKWIDKCAEEG